MNEIENAFEKMYLNHEDPNVSVEMEKNPSQIEAEINPNELSLVYHDRPG